MAPKRSTAAGGGGRTKKAAGMAQPTLAFSQRKPGAAPETGKTKSTTSISSVASIPAPTIKREDSTTSIDLTADEAPAISPAPVAAPIVAAKKERKTLNVKSKEWNGVYNDAKAAMGNMEPIHAGPDTHNQVHHILRVFDMTSKYGPSVGISRLQRWERAKKWGLNPPSEIHSILTTKEGEDLVEYRENVLHAWL